MKAILFLLMIVSFNANAMLFVDSIKINKTHFNRGEDVEVTVYFNEFYYGPNDVFEVTLQHISNNGAGNIKVIKSLSYPGLQTQTTTTGKGRIVTATIPSDYDYGDAQIYVTKNSTLLDIFIDGAPVETSVISPIMSGQKDGIVYYYTYAGILVGSEQTKQKPNIAAGLYIFRIEYYDNTFASGKIVF